MENKSQLCINGGNPTIDYKFKKYNTIGKEEKDAVIKVLDDGVLSDFLGKHHDKFYGGTNVKKFENDWSELFNIDHSISFNSATSAISAAIGACNIGTGDEVIVSPYTMAATATAIISYNAVPVFADICEKTFNMTPEAILSNITPYTKAILIPSIIGHPAELKKILKIAKDHGLYVIEDSCQAPLATLDGKLTGTFGDIGIFSLNKHKHIQTGEGGIAVTNNKNLAYRMKLIRNHGEVSVDSIEIGSLENTFGFNYRMGEMEAAIGIQQLKKLVGLVKSRISIVNLLTEKLDHLSEFIDTPFVKDNSKHVYYLYAMKYKRKKGMPHRDKIVEAICAEGVPVRSGFQKPLYLFKMYQEKIAYAGNECSVWGPLYKGNVSYKKGICPITEKVEEEEMITFHIEHLSLDERDVDNISKAFSKVFDNIAEL